VIAIIGILAAMVFPVFARARESARKAVCLSNVKNIAPPPAMTMYLTDYNDMFLPSEHRADVAEYFMANGCDQGCCYPQANPYLRWPVVLDEYTRNRDVWQCPSAKIPSIPVTIYPYPDWFECWKNGSYCACVYAYPTGWGGTVTDTNQDRDPCVTPSLDSGAIEFGYAFNEDNREMKLASIDDSVKYILVAERGVKPNWWCIEQIAFPDLCRVKLGDVINRDGCSVTCDDPVESGCGIWWEDVEDFWGDGSWQSQHTRHLGGNTLGFVDGHAKWWPAQAMVAAAGTWRDPNPGLDGVNCLCLPDAWSE